MFVLSKSFIQIIDLNNAEQCERCSLCLFPHHETFRTCNEKLGHSGFKSKNEVSSCKKHYLSAYNNFIMFVESRWCNHDYHLFKIKAKFLIEKFSWLSNLMLLNFDSDLMRPLQYNSRKLKNWWLNVGQKKEVVAEKFYEQSWL